METPSKYHLHVYLEDSKKVQELEQKISDLENQLQKAKAEKRKAEFSYIAEIDVNMRLRDELRELRGSIRNN